MQIKSYPILTLAILFFSCGQSSQSNSNAQDTLTNTKVKQSANQDTIKSSQGLKTSDSTNTWTDSLIKNYIFHTKSELVRLANKNKISEEWHFDQVVNTDTAKYYTFQIGHDVTDEGKTNKRFITDQWIYIDCLTRRLYEYDIANDSLVRWTK